MSVNILDMVKGAVSEQVLGQIGGLLGQSDSKKTSSMFETATQSILGGLMKKASSPQGAQDVFRAVQDHDDGMLDKLGDILGGGREAELEEAGGGILDLVFGDNRGGLMGAVAKFLGLDDSVMGKLMMMAAPIVMGVIGKHIKSKALDAVGLGSLLGEQKSFLNNSMSSGLTSALGFGDLLGGATDAVKDAGSAVAGAVENVGETVGNAGRAATNVAGGAADAGGSVIKFLLPLVLIAGIVFVGYKMLTGGPTGDTTSTDTGDNSGMVSIPDIDNVDFGEFDMGGLKEKFTGITDGFKNVSTDSAEGLVGKITDLTGSIDGMGIDNLTGVAKTAAGGVIGNFIETIQSALSGITDDGILGMLKPVVDTLIEKLGAFK